MNKTQFTEPTSVQDAQERLLQLKLELKDIEVQLSNRNRVDVLGNRVQGEEYWTWHNNARYASAQKQKEVIYLNDWMKRQAENANTDDTLNLLHGCYLILRQTEGLTPEQHDLFLLTHKHLKKMGRISSNAKLHDKAQQQ